MSLSKHLFVIATTVVLNILFTQFIFSAQQAPGAQTQAKETPNEALNRFEERLRLLIHMSNEAVRQACFAERTAADTCERVNKIKTELNGTDQATANLTQEKREQRVQDNIRVAEAEARARVTEEMKQGVHVVPVTEKWKNIKEIIADHKLLIKFVTALVVVILCYYIIKYGIPVLINYFARPRVISETSRTGWFRWGQSESSVDIKDLIFSPHLAQQLSDLLLRIQTAKMYDENLPNLLFFGASGTGKTAFAKALAYNSGLDYALTSGSEFAKITDLSIANDELRNLLNWAKKSDNGLLVFIDEAESLFANKQFSTTPKATQDLINTFLTLISDQSQKNVMFVLATNHPFKLDDAIANRMGINIEFTLPGELERKEILEKYLVKFAAEKTAAIVTIHSEVMPMLLQYAKSLEGFSPRAIKFVAEDMIIKARRQGSGLLINDIAQLSLNEAKHMLQQNQTREVARDKWIAALSTH